MSKTLEVTHDTYSINTGVLKAFQGSCITLSLGKKPPEPVNWNKAGKLEATSGSLAQWPWSNERSRPVTIYLHNSIHNWQIQFRNWQRSEIDLVFRENCIYLFRFLYCDTVTTMIKRSSTSINKSMKAILCKCLDSIYWTEIPFKWVFLREGENATLWASFILTILNSKFQCP